MQQVWSDTHGHASTVRSQHLFLIILVMQLACSGVNRALTYFKVIRYAEYIQPCVNIQSYNKNKAAELASASVNHHSTVVSSSAVVSASSHFRSARTRCIGIITIIFSEKHPCQHCCCCCCCRCCHLCPAAAYCVCCVSCPSCPF